MEIPKALKICGYDYQVMIRGNRYEEDGMNAEGSFSAHHFKIWLDGSQDRQGLESTLLHEIIEAIDYNFQLHLKHATISILETVLYQVLKDNKLHFGENATHLTMF